MCWGDVKLMAAADGRSIWNIQSVKRKREQARNRTSQYKTRKAKIIRITEQLTRQRSSRSFAKRIRDLTILGRQRDDDGQNKLLQINDSEDNSSYIIMVIVVHYYGKHCNGKRFVTSFAYV